MKVFAARRVVGGVTISLASATVCTVLALFVTRGTLNGDLGTALAAATVYILPLMALNTLTEKALRRRADASRFPANWVVYAGAKLILGLAAAGIGSSLAMLLGIVSNWANLYLANRMVVVVSVIASCLIWLYSTTRNSLEERNRRLEEKSEAEALTLRLNEQDFERAREIQEALMPKHLPQISRCQLAAGCQPARIVGGDYYDAIPLGDTSMAVAVGDVSGKGIGAALLMSNLQAIVRAFAPSGLLAHELCAKANQVIAANVAPGKYITFFYAKVDVARMRIDYCNAGHNPPILHRRDGAIETLGEGGAVLGVFPDASYVTGFAELRSGDCLVLFTDGISEAMNADNEEFGEERLMALLNQRSDSAQQCLERIIASATQFSNGAFHDDATLLVLTVN